MNKNLAGAEAKKRVLPLEASGIRLPAVVLDAALRPQGFSSGALKLLSQTNTDTREQWRIFQERFGLSRFREQIRHCAQHGTPYETEVRDTENNRLYSLYIRPFTRAPEPGAAFALLTLTDADTENSALSAAENNLLNAIHHPLALVDKDLNIHTANRHFYHAFLLPFPAGGNPSISEELLRDAAQWLKAIFSRKTSPQPRKIRLSLPALGERVFLLNVRLLPESGPQNELALLTAEDITSKQYQEEAHREQVRALDAANQRLQKFASEAAHDLKEPLAVLSIYTELLGETSKGTLDAESAQYLRSLQETVKKMIRLTDDLLKASIKNT